MRFLDNVPLAIVVIFGMMLALAPFVPQPHLLEKFQMLLRGELTRPIDIVDVFWHGAGLVLIGLKLQRMRRAKNSPP